MNEYDPIALTKSRILILHQLSCRSMWINAATLICINDDTAYTTDDLFVDTGLIYANQRHFFSKISRFPPSFKIRGENYIWFHTKSRKIASLSIFKNKIRCPESRNIWKQSKCKLNLYYFPMYFYSTNANVTSFKTSFFNREWQHFSVCGVAEVYPWNFLEKRKHLFSSEIISQLIRLYPSERSRPVNIFLPYTGPFLNTAVEATSCICIGPRRA